MLHEAGFPPGTVNLLRGRGDVGAALTGHTGVASVVFTGSIATGEKVAREAGLKNRILELGGNGPQIVLADANLEAAADAAVMGCFYLAGQVCTAAERVLVHRDVHDRFVELLVERTRLLQIGDPLDEATDMGPMCNAVTLERTRRHIQDAVEHGATVVHGGGSDGMYHEPTILTGVTSEMAIAREETFGPVAPIMRFDTLEIAIGNETEFGLTAAVFTNSLSDAWTAASELRHGTVHINETTNYWESHLPFGGGAGSQSGVGRVGGRFAMERLTELKTIVVHLGD